MIEQFLSLETQFTLAVIAVLLGIVGISVIGWKCLVYSVQQENKERREKLFAELEKERQRDELYYFRVETLDGSPIDTDMVQPQIYKGRVKSSLQIANQELNKMFERGYMSIGDKLIPMTRVVSVQIKPEKE